MPVDLHDVELVSVQEYLEREPERPNYVVEPLLAEGSVMMVYGASERGKTSILFQLAHAIAEGEEWLGFETHRPGPVLFIEFDMIHSEMRLFLDRAQKEGLVSDKIITPFHDIEGFDIEREKYRSWLRAACDEIEPSAVVVDTAEDIYQTIDVSNRRVKSVLNKLQAAVEPAALIFTRHIRKGSKQWSETMGDSDPLGRGGYSGHGQWEQAPTATSVQIAKTQNGESGNEQFVLKFHKTRLGNIGFDILPIKPSEHYFFTADRDYRQLLSKWPKYMPHSKREEALEDANSISDVCHQVGRDSKTNPQTVRKHYYRAKDQGVSFSWEKRIKDGDEDEGRGGL